MRNNVNGRRAEKYSSDVVSFRGLYELTRIFECCTTDML